MQPSHPFLPDRPPIPIAHRGGTEHAPENTLRAFQDAVDRGYRYIETDVHCTADGVLVAFHDDRLDRVAGCDGRIRDLTWSEVASLRLPDGDHIPSFDEVVTGFPAVRINVDPKSDAAVAPLVRTLGTGNLLERVCVGSFSDRRLGHIHDVFGEAVCLSAGPRETLALRLSSWGIGRRRPRARCAQVPTSQFGIPLVDTRFIDYCHELGVQVHVWTINDPAEMERLLDLGVDAIMTDAAAQLLEVMDRWSGPPS